MQFNTYDPAKIASHPGIRSDCLIDLWTRFQMRCSHAYSLTIPSAHVGQGDGLFR